MYRFLALVVVFFLVSPHVYAIEQDPCQEKQCMIVVDAGSTGSRLHFYTYDTDETNSPINIEEIWSKRIKPGISHVEANRSSIDAYLVTLLAGTPHSNHVPVYFYATAGMRLLPAAKQKLIYQEIKFWFAQQNQWRLMDAKTIYGSQEALYDWLAVNHQLGTLQSVQTKSVGVMDMGGASVQIVFPVQNNPDLKNNTLAEFNLYGQHIRLAVRSFLGLGQTEMSHQFLNYAPCFANNYPLPDGFLGEGDALSCVEEVASLMNGVHSVNKEIQPLLAANPVNIWYAIGGLSFLADNSVIHFNNYQLTNEQLLQQVDSKICHQEWDVLDEQFPNEEYLYQFCLLSAYYYALMVEGYGLLPNETINYLPSSQNLDWTIGVVLYPRLTVLQ
ncbi:MAG: multidrug DMT transporter permease [Legionella sp.]|nr:MAG: multidrug DMT transporter permease [Legionella sp.]